MVECLIPSKVDGILSLKIDTMSHPIEVSLDEYVPKIADSTN